MNNSMLRINKRTLRSVLVMVILLTGAAAWAGAETSGTLTLQGSVPGILQITVTPEAGASALDLSLDASNVAVATVVERSNKKAGYTVTLESANAAAGSAAEAYFSHTDPAVESSLEYSITYGGTAVTLTNGAAVISDVSGKTDALGSAKTVAVSYNGASDFPYEGTYTDILTFTIAAK